IFLRIVETAAVHGPQFARDSLPGIFRTGGRRLKTVIEPDEIERRPDPRDPGDHVQPASQEAEKLDEMRIHGAGRTSNGGYPTFNIEWAGDAAVGRRCPFRACPPRAASGCLARCTPRSTLRPISTRR